MRLYLLQYGSTAAGVPFPGYLIQTDDGANILVDTGFPEELVGAHRNEGEDYSGPRVDDEDFVLNRLAAIGLGPKDIRYVVCTHFDRDHAGNHHRFPDAEFVVQRAHYEAAQNGLERLQRVRSSWGAEGLNYRLVDGDTTLVPGVELIESSGHVPGHQSLLVRLPETGPVLLAIDAIPNQESADADTRPIVPINVDDAATRGSTRKLMALAEREGVALIIFGHDAERWATLRKSPLFYA